MLATHALFLVTTLFPLAVSANCPNGVDKLSVQIPWFSQPQFAGWEVPNSAQAGAPTYAEECLRVQVRPGGPDFDALEELREGRADVALTEGSYIASAVQGGDDLTIIANHFQRSALVIASIESHTSLEQLAGKKVGVWCCGYDIPIKMMFTQANLNPAVDITSQSFSMNQLYAGEIDMASAMIYNELAFLLQEVDPNTNFLRQRTDISEFSPTQLGIPYLHCVTVVKTSRLPELANKLARLLRVVNRAWLFCRDNEVACAQSYPRSNAHYMWQMREISKLVFPSPQGLGVMVPERWNEMTAFMANQGMLTAPIGDDIINNSFILEALNDPVVDSSVASLPFEPGTMQFCAPYGSNFYVACNTLNFEHTLCPVGKHPTGPNDGDCSDCPPGTYSYGGDGPTGPVDPTQARMLTCRACPEGYYQDQSGKTACAPCGIGTVSSGGPDSVSCVACGLGTYQDTLGQKQCLDCPRGFFMDGTGAAQCTMCSLGDWSNAIGATGCVTCTGTLTTLSLGSSSEESCVCPENSYMPSVAGQSTSCASCPNGMTCAAGSDEINLQTSQSGPYPIVKPGHWSNTQEPLSVYLCAGTDTVACPGGLPNQCGEHMEGRVCADCATNYALRDGVCTECSSIETSQFLFPILPLVLGPVVVSIMYWRSGDGYEKWGSWQNGLICVAMLLLNHCQIAALIGGSNIDYPNIMSDSALVMSHGNDVMMLLQADCAGFADFKAGFILRILSPVIGLALVLLTFGCSLVARSIDQRLAMDANRLFSVFMGIVYTFYIGIASLALSLFRCYEHPNGESSLVVAPSVLCGSDDWGQVVVFAILAIFVYCIGVLAIFVWVLWKAPERFCDPVFQLRWKFLLMKFRPDVWWWGCAFLFKGIAVNLPFIFFTEGAAQLFWVIMTVLIYSWGLVAFFPWRARASNIFEVVICGCLLMLGALAVWFSAHTPALEDRISTVAVIVSFIPFVAFLLAAAEVRGKILSRMVPDPVWADVQEAFAWLAQCKGTLSFAHLSEMDVKTLERARRIIIAELQGKQASKSKSAQRLVIKEGRGDNFQKTDADNQRDSAAVKAEFEQGQFMDI